MVMVARGARKPAVHSGTAARHCTFPLLQQTGGQTMISRTLLAAVLAVGTGTAAVAQVEVNTPGVHLKTPGGGVDLNINVGNKVAPTDAWLGRAVYSADGKHVGDVSAIAKDQVYADIGGFLGIGETRVLLDNSQILSVLHDRIVLSLTEAETKNLPPVDKIPAAPK
jgi:hypothetical protein